MPEAITETTPALYDTKASLLYNFKWVDGNIYDEMQLHVAPLTDELIANYLSQIRLQIRFDKNGDPVGNTETLNADEAARAIFEALYSTADMPVNELHKTFPQDQIVRLLNETVMNVVAERPIFKRGDVNAPKPGETVIQLTSWIGEVLNEDKEMEQCHTETKLVFRSPKAKDHRAWEAANDKHSFKRNSKGKIELKLSQVDVHALRELLFGSELKQIEPLFLRGENYASGAAVPFYHVYLATSVLMEEALDLGKLSKRLSSQS